MGGEAGEALAHGVGVPVGEESEGRELRERGLSAEVLRVGGGGERLGVGRGKAG